MSSYNISALICRSDVLKRKKKKSFSNSSSSNLGLRQTSGQHYLNHEGRIEDPCPPPMYRGVGVISLGSAGSYAQRVRNARGTVAALR